MKASQIIAKESKMWENKAHKAPKAPKVKIQKINLYLIFKFKISSSKLKTRKDIFEILQEDKKITMILD